MEGITKIYFLLGIISFVVIIAALTQVDNTSGDATKIAEYEENIVSIFKAGKSVLLEQRNFQETNNTNVTNSS